jgi:hypothetical protein
MRQFRWYVETAPGFIRRKLPAEAVTPAALAALDRAMVGHFGRLWARAELAALRAHQFGTVVSVGGGHPNLEAGLRAESIVVCDPLWKEYATAQEAFCAAWPDAPPVEWRSEKRWTGIAADLVVFCHVLEHVPVEEAAQWLARVRTAADILIYGPNADLMRADSWLHALPVHEHLWLAGLQWTKAWAEWNTGRTARVAIGHDLDLLLWLPGTGGDVTAGGGGLADEAPMAVGDIREVTA